MLETKRNLKKSIIFMAITLLLVNGAVAYAETSSGEHLYGWKYTFTGNYGTYDLTGSTYAEIDTSSSSSYTNVVLYVDDVIVSTVKKNKRTVDATYNTGTKKSVKVFHSASTGGGYVGGYTLY